MQSVDGRYIYSPSDLITFLENEAVSWLDRYNLEQPGELDRDQATEDQQIIRDAGDKHEKSFLARLTEEDRDVAHVRNVSDPYGATLAFMREGREIIYQARLESEPFAGYSDFLVRVDGDSELGPYHYEVWDTKLARSLRPYFAVQLCCYAEMLKAMQGVLPAQVGIILGNGQRERLRTLDYWYYYVVLKRAFLEQQRSFDRTTPPDIPPRGDFQHWTGYVEELLERRDDLSRVAGIRALQVKRLRATGIYTMAALAANTEGCPRRISPATFEQASAADAAPDRLSRTRQAPIPWTLARCRAAADRVGTSASAIAKRCLLRHGGLSVD